MIKTIVIVALFIGTTVLGVIFFNLQRGNKKLHDQLNSLQNKILELETMQKATVLEKVNLERQIKLQELENAKANLIKDYNSARGFTPRTMITSDVMETKIDGDFEGWEGETIFKMINGTIWQQDEYDYTYHYEFMPDVIIYRKNGSYYMKVEDVNEEIRVRQIK